MKRIKKYCLLMLVVVFVLECKNHTLSVSEPSGIGTIVNTCTSIIASASNIKITKDNAGSILQLESNNYSEYANYIHLNAIAYLSDYYVCSEDFIKIGNTFTSNNDCKYEIKNVNIDSHLNKDIYLYNAECHLYYYAYYDENLKRINIMPNIEIDNYNNVELDIYKDALIISTSIDPIFISSVINGENSDNDSMYFTVESDCFDENNFVVKLVEYDWNEGD